jgi:hypothetical protein
MGSVSGCDDEVVRVRVGVPSSCVPDRMQTFEHVSKTRTHLKPHRLQNHPPKRRSAHLLPENTTHRRPEPNAKHKLVQAKEAFVRVHDAVVMHHSDHQPARESVAIEQSDRGHGVGQQPVPEAIESLREEAGSGSGVLEV